MWKAFLRWLFALGPEPLDVRLRRVVAADHVNGRRGRPVTSARFTGWWYLYEARRALHAAA